MYEITNYFGLTEVLGLKNKIGNVWNMKQARTIF